MTRGDLPYLFERDLAAFGKLDVVLLRIAPGLAEVIRGTKKRSPERAVDRSPQTTTPIAPVISHRIDAASGEVRPGLFPFFSLGIGAKHKRALHRADEHEIVT